ERYKVWLAKNISQQKEEKVLNLNLRGVHLHKKKVRYYPQKQSGAHVIGVVGKGLGLAGVEHTYNELLNKSDDDLLEEGAELLEEDKAAQQLNQYLVLTIDLKIQQILDSFVGELGKRYDDIRIGAMLMESRSGKIIGQAVYPTYDPNAFHEVGREEHRNILAEPIRIPPVMRKLFWDASLLQGYIENNDMLLPWSVMANTRDIGSQLRMWDHLGLNDPLETDFVNADMAESDQELPFQSDKTNIYHDSVAQTATPLHIAAAINSLSLGGARPVPHVLDRMVGKNGRIYKLPSGKTEQAVDDQVAEEVRNLLAAQVKPGPLSSGQLETSFLSYKDVPEGRHYFNNSLLFSLIPQEMPELMLFVFTQLPPFTPSFVETKSKFSISESANKITVPMVAMQKVMSNLSDMMSVEEKSEMNFEMQGKPVKYASKSEPEKLETAGAMPDLRGFSLRKSLRMLGELKLEIQISGTGVVVEQEPAAGRLVPANSLCRLLLKPH
ncbi:MAG: hypothetical protein GVY02_00265, partial [Bacteroidetes bacterium]|nr:hypothetical protein [Bacteroidota bacterium]